MDICYIYISMKFIYLAIYIFTLSACTGGSELSEDQMMRDRNDTFRDDVELVNSKY
jgi:hypothetical protein